MAIGPRKLRLERRGGQAPGDSAAQGVGRDSETHLGDEVLDGFAVSDSRAGVVPRMKLRVLSRVNRFGPRLHLRRPDVADYASERIGELRPLTPVAR